MLAVRELLRAEHMGKIAGKDFVIQVPYQSDLPPCYCPFFFVLWDGSKVL